MRTMKQVYDKSMSRTAFTLTLLAISGGMALLLAAVGIYAVISYTVAQRTREIGIRMALGAQQGKLKMMFVRNGLLWGGIGAAAGLTAAAALSRLMSTLLFEISPVDPLTYSVVAIELARSGGGGQLFAGAPGHARRPRVTVAVKNGAIMAGRKGPAMWLRNGQPSTRLCQMVYRRRFQVERFSEALAFSAR